MRARQQAHDQQARRVSSLVSFFSLRGSSCHSLVGIQFDAFAAASHPFAYPVARAGVEIVSNKLRASYGVPTRSVTPYPTASYETGLTSTSRLQGRLRSSLST